MFYIGKQVRKRRIFSLIVIIIIYQRLLLLKFSRAQIACGYLWLWLSCYCSEDIEIPKFRNFRAYQNFKFLIICLSFWKVHGKAFKYVDFNFKRPYVKEKLLGIRRFSNII